MQGKITVAIMVIAIALGSFLALSSVESSCQPGEPCWDSYAATATAVASYPAPYPEPGNVEPVAPETTTYYLYLSTVKVPMKYDCGPYSRWSEKVRLCWPGIGN